MNSIGRGGESGIAQHLAEKHPNVSVGEAKGNIKMKILARSNRNMERCILEALLIEKAEQSSSIISANRRGEWGRHVVRRLGVQER